MGADAEVVKALNAQKQGISDKISEAQKAADQAKDDEKEAEEGLRKQEGHAKVTTKSSSKVIKPTGDVSKFEDGKLYSLNGVSYKWNKASGQMEQQ